jgi:hypothetical protein
MNFKILFYKVFSLVSKDYCKTLILFCIMQNSPICKTYKVYLQNWCYYENWLITILKTLF